MPNILELPGDFFGGLPGPERHTIGEPTCPECPSWESLPFVHAQCGGLVHGYSYDEDWNEETNDEFHYWQERCDRCGADGAPGVLHRA